MKKFEWELMKPEDIEIRPAQIKDGKATLLSYQNGRNTMEALDRHFGHFGWKIEYKDVAGQIYGRLSIYDPDQGAWIYKEDTGEESNISAEKGLSTDILKRCAVRFGYGRELYTIPKIVVDDDGYGCHYKVGEVEWNDNRECVHITLVNKFGKVMYTWSKDATVKEAHKEESKCNCDVLKDFCSEKKREDDVDKEDLLRFYNFYKEKCLNWEGDFKVGKLWERWKSTKR